MSKSNKDLIKLSHNNFRKFYTININKYKAIYDNVSLGIKSSYKKKQYNLNHKKSNYINKKKVIFKTENSLKKNRKKSSIDEKSDEYESLPNLEYYENTLENEFNCRELIKMDNSKLLQKLKLLKRYIYDKNPIYIKQQNN